MKLTQEELKGIERNLHYVVDNSDGWLHLHLNDKCHYNTVSVAKERRLFRRKWDYYARWSVEGIEVELEDAEEIYNYCVKVSSRYKEELLIKKSLQEENQLKIARQMLLK